MLKRVLLVLLSIVLLMSLTGCSILRSVIGNQAGGDSQTSGDSQTDDDKNGFGEMASKILKSQGRTYDELYTGQMGETLTNSFFEFKIDSAKLLTELAGYLPETDGNKFLVADVEVTNIFEETIPVGNYDFYVLWNGGEDIPYNASFDWMYPDDAELAVGETLSGKLVFEIPPDAEDVMIGYTEIWDDEFEGNIYLVEIVTE